VRLTRSEPAEQKHEAAVELLVQAMIAAGIDIEELYEGNAWGKLGQTGLMRASAQGLTITVAKPLALGNARVGRRGRPRHPKWARLIGVFVSGASLCHRGETGRHSEACTEQQEAVLVLVREVGLLVVLVSAVLTSSFAARSTGVRPCQSLSNASRPRSSIFATTHPPVGAFVWDKNIIPAKL
jgi:hypothetical protein